MAERPRGGGSQGPRCFATAGLAAALLLASCSGSAAPWSSPKPVDGGLPGVPVLENPRSEDGKLEVRVLGGALPHLAGHITHLDAGPRTLLVVHAEATGTEASPQPIALWLRGHGSAQHRLPQYSSGFVNPGNRQDWDVDLPPGDYVLSVTLGPESPSAEAHFVVR